MTLFKHLALKQATMEVFLEEKQISKEREERKHTISSHWGVVEYKIIHLGWAGPWGWDDDFGFNSINGKQKTLLSCVM